MQTFTFDHLTLKPNQIIFVLAIKSSVKNRLMHVKDISESMPRMSYGCTHMYALAIKKIIKCHFYLLTVLQI